MLFFAYSAAWAASYRQQAVSDSRRAIAAA